MADKLYKNKKTGESYFVPADYKLSKEDKEFLADFEEESLEEVLDGPEPEKSAEDSAEEPAEEE